MNTKEILEKLKEAKSYVNKDGGYITLKDGLMIIDNNFGVYTYKNELFKDIEAKILYSDFYKIINKLKNKEIELSQGKESLTITYDKLSIKIKSTEVNLLWSEIFNAEYDFIFNINKKEMESINKAFSYVSKDDLRPILNSVCISTDGKIYATDSFCLCFYNTDLKTKDDIIIPKTLLYECELFSSLNFLKIDYNNGVVVYFYKIKNKFPNAKLVIPTKYNYEYSFNDSNKLLENISIAKIIGNKITGSIIFDFFRGVLTSKDIDFGNSIEWQFDNHCFDLRIAVRIEQLEKIIKTEKLKKINLKFTDCDRVVVINENILLMPILS